MTYEEKMHRDEMVTMAKINILDTMLNNIMNDNDYDKLEGMDKIKVCRVVRERKKLFNFATA